MHCSPTCQPHPNRTFCPSCGKADRSVLNTIRLPGFVGVVHSTSPKIEQFWETGDPTVFSTPA